MVSRSYSIIFLFFIAATEDLKLVNADEMGRIKEIPVDLNVPSAVETSEINITSHNSIVACRVNKKAQEEKSEANYNIFNENGPFDGNLCTHLIYGPLYVNTTYQLPELEEEFTSERLAGVNNISKKFPHLKLLLEVTYENNNSQMATLTVWDYKLHSVHFEFIANMKRSVSKCGFHGIFLEKAFYTTRKGSFQYGDFLANKRPNRTEILALYLRDSFRKEGLIVAAEMEMYPKRTVKSQYKSLQSFTFWLSYGRISELSYIFDFVVVSGYQPNYRENNLSRYNAPLFSTEPEGFSIFERLKTIIFDWGANPNTVVLGIPFFGHYYLLSDSNSSFGYNVSSHQNVFPGPLLRNKNYWGYNEICKTKVFNKNAWKMYWDNVAKVPFLKRNNHWITFDNSQSISAKVSLAIELGLRGIMAYSIDTDDFHGNCSKIKHPLLKTINYSLQQSLVKKNSLRCALYKNDTITLHKPLVSVDFLIQTLPLNRTVLINCYGEGYGEVDVEIVKDGVVHVSVNSTKKLETHNCVMQVRKTLALKKQSVTADKYSCVANNSMGHSQRDFFLQTENWPILIAENDIWLQRINTDFNVPAIKNSILTDEQMIVCKVNRQEPETKGQNKHYYSPKRLQELVNEKLCSFIIYGPFLVNRKFEFSEKETKDLEIVKNLTEIFPTVKIILEITIDHHRKDGLGYLPTVVTNRFSTFIRKQGCKGVHFDSSIYFDNDDSLVGRNRYYEAILNHLKAQGLMATTEVALQSKKAFEIIDHDRFLSNIFDMVFLKMYNSNRSFSFEAAINNSALEFLYHQNEMIKINLEKFLSQLKSRKYSLLIGIELYGYQYVIQKSESHSFGFNDQPVLLGNTLGYNDICSTALSSNENWAMFWDNKARIPFIKTGRSWITFDTPKSIYEKIRFYSTLAQKFKLGGIVVDSIDNDDFVGECSKDKYPLLKTVYDALNKKPDSETETWSIGWWWIFSICCLLFLSILLIIAFVLLYKKNPSEVLTRREIKAFLKGTENVVKTNEIEENPDHLPYNTLFEIAPTNYKIKAYETLGSGAYGIVFKGEVNENPVAVKSVKPGADKQYLKSLLSELKILIYIGRHENIVNLIGASTTELKKGIVYIFVEFCPIGNLQDFLRLSRPLFRSSAQYCNFRQEKKAIEEGAESIITTDNLIIWCYQVAKGMQHLSEKKIIHGDLATRNILVFEKNCVKITDFGLSRKLYNYSDYVKKNEEPLPWRWMAIESLRDLIFSFQSDVWSFGITMWEIFTLAEVPYPGLSWTPEFIDLLKKSLRLQKPLHATERIYSFMLDCWRENPLDRPKPEEVTKFFFNLTKSLNGTD